MFMSDVPLEIRENKVMHPRSSAIIAIVIAFFFCLGIGFLLTLDQSGDMGLFSTIIAAERGVPAGMGLMLLLYPYFCGKTRAFVMRKNDGPLVILCGILAMFYVVGWAVALHGSVKPLVASKSAFLFASLSVIAIGAVLFSFLKYVERSVSCLKAPDDSLKICIWKFGIAFFLIWLLYVLIFAPGIISNDMLGELQQFKDANYSTHHPLFPTLLYGFIYWNLHSIFGQSAATFSLAFLQVCCQTIAACYLIYTIHTLRAPRIIINISIVFLSVNPLFGLYAMWINKDTLFGATFVVFVCSVAMLLFLPDRVRLSRKSTLTTLILSATLCGLLRNNGGYVIAIALLFLCVYFARRKQCFTMILLLLTIGMIPCLNGVMAAATQAQPGSVKEMLSIPFQQTARYALLHDDDMTEEERKIIDDTLAYDSLADRYNPVVSDPVKTAFKPTADLGEYFKVWMTQGMRHPLTYMDAVLEHSFNYWTILPNSDNRVEYATFRLYDGDRYESQHFVFPSALRDFVYQAVAVFRNIPVLEVLSQASFYFWLLLCVICGSRWRNEGARKNILFCCIPFAILWLTCIAGPLNGSMRYMYGFVFASPLLLALPFARQKASVNRAKSEIS